MTTSHALMIMVSLSLWFGGGPAEHLLHPPSLGHVGLEILGSVCYPGGVKLSGVLVHQVGVLSAAWATKVLHLKQSCNSKDNPLLCFHFTMCKACVKFQNMYSSVYKISKVYMKLLKSNITMVTTGTCLYMYSIEIHVHVYVLSKGIRFEICSFIFWMTCK